MLTIGAGMPISANYTGGGPPAEGGIVVSFSDPDIEAIAKNIASDELHQCVRPGEAFVDIIAPLLRPAWGLDTWE